MRMLLDQGLPRSTASLLRKVGWDVFHASELGLAEAEDVIILERGRAEARIVVTLDADFHALLARSQAVQPSVIRIRIEGLRAEDVAVILQTIAMRCRTDLDQGCVVSVQADRIRLRRLPLAAPNKS